jgi:putative serine protease PepD
VKRLLATILLAAGVGAATASVAALVLGIGIRHSAPAASTSTASSQGASPAGARREIASTALTATQIYKQDATGVVSIQAVTSRGTDSGTGIVLNQNGLILTNDHVIAGASTITVGSKASAGATYPATLVGEEANSDLALIRVDPSRLDVQPLVLVSSSSDQVGEAVYAIGNPYGLDETLTRGIISALGRDISAPDGAKITGAIQTDAALNPGNSGGPLLNEQGQVIGVNSQIASDEATDEGSQPGNTGVGFAISSNTIVPAIRKIESGRGLSFASVNQTERQTEGGNSGRLPDGPQGTYGEVEAGSSSTEAEGRPNRSENSMEGSSEVDSTGSGAGGVGGEGQVAIVP